MDGTGVNLFVEINSYAIALVFFSLLGRSRGNSMGLILGARGFVNLGIPFFLFFSAWRTSSSRITAGYSFFSNSRLLQGSLSHPPLTCLL